MTLAPEPGLVIRYDFLWQADEATGAEYGLKDRPCVVILVSSPRDDNARDVIVCPISHTPPDAETPAVEIPYKVARYLRLDPGRMWITTRQVNVFRWEDGRIPVGVTRPRKGAWAFGRLPRKLAEAAFEQVRRQSTLKQVAVIRRD